MYKAQQLSRVHGDWIELLDRDKTLFDIKLSDEEIKSMSKYKFKKLVDKKIKEKAAQYLTELQTKHSKSKVLHQSPNIKEYLTTDQLSTREKQMLFKLRTMTTPNRSHFKGKYKDDLSCTLCKDPTSVESLKHLLVCSYLLNDNQLSKEIKSIKYEHIFGELKEQIDAVKVRSKIFKIYETKNKK